MTTLEPGQPTDDVPHTVQHDPHSWPEATELEPGVTLFTKDGRQIGNAIVVRELPPHPAAADYLKQTGQKSWLVETDFGNRTTLCTNEIMQIYELGFQQDYDTWWQHRIEAIEKTVD